MKLSLQFPATLLTVPRPHAGGSITARSKISGGFHGLAQTGSAPLAHPVTREPSRRCGLRFMLRTGQLLHPASTPASQPKPGASLPRTLASPRTGLAPAGYRELPLGYVMTAPLRSSVRAAGRTWIEAKDPAEFGMSARFSTKHR